MNVESVRVLRLGFMAGVVLGVLAVVWRRSIGAPAANVALWAVGLFVIVMVIAGLSLLGMRLQRKNVPPAS